MQKLSYNLLPEKIATHPLTPRDAAKLLVYKNGNVSESTFQHLAEFLPENSLLVLNDTKVIHARILFQTEEGKTVEIFCLEPIEPATMEQALAVREKTIWKCMIGNNRAWKMGVHEIILQDGRKISITRQRDTGKEFVIEFVWQDNTTFYQILEKIGHVPLPPYMKRSDEVIDQQDYQTVFAQKGGAVAAPTASLHFTPELLNNLRTSGTDIQYITLHVGAGTFLPITSQNIEDHVMHGEVVHISKLFLENLLHHIKNKNPIIASGTTVLRALESLVWLELGTQEVAQWAWKNNSSRASRESIVEDLLNYMHTNSLEEFSFRTHIMIVPGYEFTMIDALITNFHQPESTLLLLVAACIGDDWQKVYEYALGHDFRFLSYGDGSLLCKNHPVSSACGGASHPS